MKIFRRSLWGVLGLQILILIFIVRGFQVDDMTLSKGRTYDFNLGWTLEWPDGSSQSIRKLPCAIDCPAGKTVTIENRIPKEYAGQTLSFLSADKTVKVWVDGALIYEFGTHDEKSFGHTPGSVVNFIDLPEELYSGQIRIEMTSPYDNYAANIGSMIIAKRDVAILKLLKKNLFPIICCVLIAISGIILIIMACLRKFSGQNSGGLEFLSAFCLVTSVYYFIETKTLGIFYGNQCLYSFMVFFVLMLMPLCITLYFEKSLLGDYRIRMSALIGLCYLNAVVQLILQLTDRVDFMNMAFLSHGLILVTIVTVLLSLYDMSWKSRTQNIIWEFVAMACMGLGGLVDLVRVYAIKVGDLGEYSRYGTTLFSLIMVIIHIRQIGMDYAASVEENARLLQREVETVERQNQELRLAKEEAEAAKQEAEDANNAKSLFLANMSHEIRTPINAILGMDTMILRESGDEQIRDYAGDIQNAGNNLLSLINDILDLSKIESGKMEVLPVNYDLFELLKDSYNMIHIRAEERNLEFRIMNQPKLPHLLYGDGVRIRQIMMNLLTNAVKYTNEGSVTLSVTWEELQEEQILLKFAVSDIGIGISTEDQKKLFDSFTRVDEVRNHNVEGTGLGLTITKNLVELLGGKILVSSELGKGSVFRVEVPQQCTSREPMGDFRERYRQQMERKQEYQTKFQAPDAHILVVDDVEVNLKVFCNLIKETQVQIDTATSGAQCLEMVQEKPYDIIFLDHMMPEMGGIEVFQEMQKMGDYPNKETPVIMLTANAIVGAKEEYMEMGFRDYLSKPIKEEELEEMLIKYLAE